MIPFILAAVGGYFIGDSMKESQTFSEGGVAGKLPKVGSKVSARWNDNMRWSSGIYKGETKNGFEVYDMSIERPEYIEYYSQISEDPHYGTEIFKSKKFKDRNYKNYNFKKFAEGGVTFQDKVSAISKKLEGTKVPKRLEKDYGKKYSKEESIKAAQRITGSMVKKGY